MVVFYETCKRNIFKNRKEELNQLSYKKFIKRKKKSSLLQKMGEKMLSHKTRGEKDKKTIRNAKLDAYKDAGNKKYF